MHQVIVNFGGGSGQWLSNLERTDSQLSIDHACSCVREHGSDNNDLTEIANTSRIGKSKRMSQYTALVKASFSIDDLQLPLTAIPPTNRLQHHPPTGHRRVQTCYTRLPPKRDGEINFSSMCEILYG